jgi:energy-coupling factor transporter ATP-binding protein EcfA2
MKGTIVITHNIKHRMDVTDRVIVEGHGGRATIINFAPCRNRRESLDADRVKMISGLECQR